LSKRSSFEESVFYLNSTVHHMRAALQRQTDRSLTISSQLLRLTSESGRTNRRVEVIKK